MVKSPVSLVSELCQTLDQVKAIDIQCFEFGKIEHPCFDTAIIASGSSKAHVRGISEKLELTFKDKLLGVEGRLDKNWVLLDFGTAIVHIFLDELREFYDLESLYQNWLKEVTANIHTPDNNQKDKKTSISGNN